MFDFGLVSKYLEATGGIDIGIDKLKRTFGDKALVDRMIKHNEIYERKKRDIDILDHLNGGT
jgi:hypothetical protein